MNGERTSKKLRPLVDIKGRNPKEFNRALHMAAGFEEFAKQLTGVTPEAFMRGALARHVKLAQDAIAVIEPWIGEFRELRKAEVSEPMTSQSKELCGVPE